MPNFVSRDYATRLAALLAADLADNPRIAVSVLEPGEIAGQTVFLVQTRIEDGPDLFWDPFTLDNGASGVRKDVLVTLRNLAGENLPVPPPPTDRPGKFFADIISLG